MKRFHCTLQGGRGWQGGMIPCQAASSPMNAGADSESTAEPRMHLDGGIHGDRDGKWGSD